MELLTELYQKVLDSVPKILLSIGIIVAGLIIATIFKRISKTILKKIGVDKLGEKLYEIDFIRKSNISIKISKFISTIIYYFVALIAIILASDMLQLQALSELIGSLISFIPQLIMAFVVLIVGILFSDFLRKIIYTTCDSLGIPSAKIISLIVFYFLLINVAMVTLSQAGINTGFIEQNVSIMIAGAVAAFAIGYGLASKGSVENFLSSNNMSKYVEEGDIIKIGEHKGIITEMNSNTVTLETEESHIVIPIRKFANEEFEIIK